MNNFPEKNKNDFEFYYKDNETEKAKPAPPDKQRAGCLTAYLIYLIFGNVIALLFFLNEAINVIRNSHDYKTPNEAFLLVLVLIPIQLLVVGCAIALWKWKRWGYIGLRIGYGISLMINLVMGNLLGVVGAFIGLGFLMVLVNPIKDLLE
jgi:hypothetical protein